LTWSNPATASGAGSANCSGASIPPIVTFTCSNGAPPLEPVTFPVWPAGEVCPPPVAKIWITDPRAAAFPTPFTEESWFSTAPCPTPAATVVKIAGEAPASGTSHAPDTWLFEVTRIRATPLTPVS
jgi:hypothetical protein